MTKIKLNINSLKHINLFQRITKAGVKDCIFEDSKVMFIVNSGQAGIAIGRNGSNIKKIQRMINKKVEVIEFNNDLLSFLNNIFRPIKVKDCEDCDRNGRSIIKITVESTNHEVNQRALARSKIKKARLLLKKYFDIDDINFG